MPDAQMCGMAENKHLWPIEKHWLNVRFLNGSRQTRDLVQSIVEEHINSLPMGIKFYFYQRHDTGEADIRIKFTDMSDSYVGTSAKLVDQSSEPTMRLDFETPTRLNGEDRRLFSQRAVLHEFGHALGLLHEHQYPSWGKKWNMTLLQCRTGWSRQLVHQFYAPRSPEGKTLEPYDSKSIMHYEIREGDVLDSKLTAPRNNVLSEGDKRILTLLYPPREEGMFKAPGDNSETSPPKKEKRWQHLDERIVRNQDKPAVELVSEKELSAYSRFTKNSYGELMTLFAKTVAERTRPGQRLDVEEHDLVSHAYGRSEGICGIVDEFLSKHPQPTWAIGEPTLAFPELKDYLSKYQDPQQADSILKIQKELDETKIVLHKTIESVLQRGEKIDDLVAKSDGLSAQSKMFHQREIQF
ncbi:hypothetical protein Neosp_013943 [[Neocosmospora] mangrovei]